DGHEVPDFVCCRPLSSGLLRLLWNRLRRRATLTRPAPQGHARTSPDLKSGSRPMPSALRSPPRIHARWTGLAAIAIGGLALTACATAPIGGAATGPAVFSADDFAWSTRAGQASIDGRVAFAQDGQAFACAGNVGLIPDT